ncbi:AAA-like domain-containing protein [candidate division WOR-3 bacterium]|nr:AAA-like domain-containing protein [candidate division WOR-3 bacterium]
MNGIYSKLGHLIGIYDLNDDPNGFIFLSISGEEDTKAVVSILKGIRGVGKSIKKDGTLKESPVLDFGDISYKHPETEELTIHTIPMKVFWDNKKKEFKERLFEIGVKNLLHSRGGFFPTNFIGGVASGSDFFNREEKIEEIKKKLRKNNLIISAPRRFGKTSLLFALKVESINNWFPVHIDLERIHSPIDFVAHLDASIKTGNELKRNEIIEKIQRETIDWKRKGDKLFEENQNNQYLLLMDEFSFMLDYFEPGGEVDRFLHWFYLKRKQYDNFHFIIISSIDLKVYVEDKDINSSYFDDLYSVKLDPFDRETGMLFVESLLYAYEVYPKENIAIKIVELTGYLVPFFLQIFTAEVITYYAKHKSITNNDIDKIYTDHLLGPDCRRYMDDFYNHIVRHYGEKRARRAKVILNKLSISDNGCSLNELKSIYKEKPGEIKDLEILLKYLAYDFYIKKEDDHYRFLSHLLREYWKRYQ